MNIEHEVRKIIVDALRLNVAPEELDTKTPFLEMGLQVDSLTGLRIVLSLEERFNFKIKTGDLTRKVFSSIDNLIEFVNKKINS